MKKGDTLITMQLMTVVVIALFYGAISDEIKNIPVRTKTVRDTIYMESDCGSFYTGYEEQPMDTVIWTRSCRSRSYRPSVIYTGDSSMEFRNVWVKQGVSYQFSPNISINDSAYLNIHSRKIYRLR